MSAEPKVRGSNLTPSKRSLAFNPFPTFTILVKATGKKVEGLSVENVHEPEKGDASIVFITKAGKKWKLHLFEFSFFFPSQ